MTLIPDLERQLTRAAAGRSAARRRAAWTGAVALVAAASLAAALALDAREERDVVPAGPLGLDIPAGREPRLADLFAVFAREQTPRDDSGWTRNELNDIPDRQPGEDPTRSRRVGPASEPIYIWPMKGGVCSSFGNCLPLDVLVDVGGVAFGTSAGYRRDGSADHLGVEGIVVDGIEEIRLTRPGAPDIVVPVERNTFQRDVTDARPVPTGARWTDAAGREHTFGGRELFPAPPPPPRP
jgi:hypothetical protein